MLNEVQLNLKSSDPSHRIISTISGIFEIKHSLKWLSNRHNSVLTPFKERNPDDSLLLQVKQNL